MKLLIAIPTTDYMPFQFVESLTNLVRQLERDGIDFDVAFQGGTLVYVGRDKLTMRSMYGNYTHVLWLDSDMVFSEEIFDDLYETGKDFVTGICVSRREPYPRCIFSEIYPSVRRYEGDLPILPFKIAACGMACVLMKTEILSDVWAHNGTAFFPHRELGEDIAFCKRATDLGWEIWAEPHARVGHVGQKAIYPDDCWVLENNHA